MAIGRPAWPRAVSDSLPSSRVTQSWSLKLTPDEVTRPSPEAIGPKLEPIFQGACEWSNQPRPGARSATMLQLRRGYRTNSSAQRATSSLTIRPHGRLSPLTQPTTGRS
jgi:hypothetical protein